MVPEPRQETESAWCPPRASVGAIAWVAFHIGRKPSQYSGQPAISCWCEERKNCSLPSSPFAYSSFTKRNSRLYTVVSIIMYERAMGIVHATCFPASRPATHMSAWSGGGVLMCTMSMSRSRRSSA